MTPTSLGQIDRSCPVLPDLPVRDASLVGVPSRLLQLRHNYAFRGELGFLSEPSSTNQIAKGYRPSSWVFLSGRQYFSVTHRNADRAPFGIRRCTVISFGASHAAKSHLSALLLNDEFQMKCVEGKSALLVRLTTLKTKIGLASPQWKIICYLSRSPKCIFSWRASGFKKAASLFFVWKMTGYQKKKGVKS